MGREEIEKQMDELARQAANLKNTLALVGEQYSRQMNALAEKITASVKSLQPGLEALRIDWAETARRTQQSCEKLANLGWSLPMTFAPVEMFELRAKPVANAILRRRSL